MKNLLILFGGKSNEHEVSLVSAANVIDATDKKKYNIFKVGITKDGAWWLYSGDTSKIKDGSWETDKDNLTPAVISPCTVHHGIITFNKASHTYQVQRIDVVFPVLHGSNGEDGTMQGLLKVGGIPYVGCDTFASAVAMNKTAAKVLAQKRGVKSTPFISVNDYEKDTAIARIKEANLKYPLFVKPQSAGSSVGITKVKTEDSLDNALSVAFDNDVDRTAIIEEGVTGKEIEVALLGNGADILVSSCGEIVPGREFYDYENKYNDDTALYYAPARLNDKIASNVQKAAKNVFEACGCSGLARCDFFVTADGEILFNEINTIPGFTPISMYSKLLSLKGLSMTDIIDKLVAIAEKRG